MTPNEYQQAAKRTWEPGTRGLSPAGVVIDWMYLSGKMAFEAGEAAQHIAKWGKHGKPLDREAVASEIGDVIWYAAMLAWELGCNLEEIMQANIDKLTARHPDGDVSKHYQEAA